MTTWNPNYNQRATAAFLAAASELKDANWHSRNALIARMAGDDFSEAAAADMLNAGARSGVLERSPKQRPGKRYKANRFRIAGGPEFAALVAYSTVLSSSQQVDETEAVE